MWDTFLSQHQIFLIGFLFQGFNFKCRHIFFWQFEIPFFLQSLSLKEMNMPCSSHNILLLKTRLQITIILQFSGSIGIRDKLCFCWYFCTLELNMIFIALWWPCINTPPNFLVIFSILQRKESAVVIVELFWYYQSSLKEFEEIEKKKWKTECRFWFEQWKFLLFYWTEKYRWLLTGFSNLYTFK